MHWALAIAFVSSAARCFANKQPGILTIVLQLHTLYSTLAAAGRKRWAHVYLPPSYDGSKQFPLWVHLHGVYWATMDNISQKVGVVFVGLRGSVCLGSRVSCHFLAGKCQAGFVVVECTIAGAAELNE